MKHVLLAGSLLLLSVTSFAQMKVENSYTHSYSQPYKYQRKYKTDYLNTENFIYSISITGNKLILEIADKNKNILINQVVYEDVIPKKGEYETTIQNENEVFIIYSLWDKTEKRDQLFVLSFDKQKQEINKTPRLLFNSFGKVSGSYSGSFGFYDKSFDKYVVFKSPDNKKTLIKYRKNPAEKKDKFSNDVFVFNYLDDNLNLIASKEIAMPFTERKMNNLNYLYRNNGDFIFIEKVFHNDTNDDKENNSKNYDVFLLALKENDNELVQSKLNLENKFVNQLDIKEGQNNKLAISGLYSNGGLSTKNVDGFMTSNLSDSYEISNLHFNEIPSNLINLYEAPKELKQISEKISKGEGALNDLKIKSTMLNQDGSIVIIAEEYFRYYHMNSKDSYFTFHYNDTYVTKIDASGKLLWINKIPKQVVESDYCSRGYNYIFDNAGNSHYLIMKSDGENLKWIDETKFNSSKFLNDENILIYKISDTNGGLSASHIINLSDNDLFDGSRLNPNNIMSSKNNFHIMDLDKGKNENIIMKIDLN